MENRLWNKGKKVKIPSLLKERYQDFFWSFQLAPTRSYGKDSVSIKYFVSSFIQQKLHNRQGKTLPAYPSCPSSQELRGSPARKTHRKKKVWLGKKNQNKTKRNKNNPIAAALFRNPNVSYLQSAVRARECRKTINLNPLTVTFP